MKIETTKAWCERMSRLEQVVCSDIEAGNISGENNPLAQLSDASAAMAPAARKVRTRTSGTAPLAK